ncbi:lysylphosphatidylglycerol synthase transmembrane domain-containing protein [Haladaptatus pallidirubidus]|uniref:lysylphosphatidylglycerol synthase transmembrane domain-containing protein n=1 Tax=Haladaptatus pallidirubidus TaxID=1008152 RepID=UPI001D11C161|nr:lysylphosphatidylglycerol synthase transmembrane domain-containing protein [Haladaptatus pallidirubidus]
MNQKIVRFLFVVFSLCLLGYFVGGSQIRAELASANSVFLVLGFSIVLVALFCWSEAVRCLLDCSETPIGGWRFRGAYLASFFAKQIVPIGRASSPFLLAHIVSSEMSTDRDQTLGVALVIEVLNLTAALSLGVIGLVFLALRGQSLTAFIPVPSLQIAILLTGGFLAATTTLYRYKHLLLHPLTVVGVRMFSLLRALSENRTQRLHLRIRLVQTRIRFIRTYLRLRVRSYSTEVNLVLENRRQIALALGWSVIGWICFCLPLYASFLALNQHVSILLPLFLIPASGVARVVPLPGGLGGVEVILGAMIIVLTGVDAGTAGGVVLLYRLLSFWGILVLGWMYSMYFINIGQVVHFRQNQSS